MATGMGETLHHSPRNAESFRIKRRAFRLIPPDGGLLVVDIWSVTKTNEYQSFITICSSEPIGLEGADLQFMKPPA